VYVDPLGRQGEGEIAKRRRTFPLDKRDVSPYQYGVNTSRHSALAFLIIAIPLVANRRPRGGMRIV
jgi:hypothetical protein